MATNTGALQKTGVPPPRGKAPNIIKADLRPSEGKNKPLQVMVPPEAFEAFSQRAGEEFGFNKGAKSQLFLAMWDAVVGKFKVRAGPVVGRNSLFDPLSPTSLSAGEGA